MKIGHLEWQAAAFLAHEREQRRQERDEAERREAQAAYLRAQLVVLEAIERHGVAWPGEY